MTVALTVELPICNAELFSVALPPTLTAVLLTTALTVELPNVAEMLLTTALTVLLPRPTEAPVITVNPPSIDSELVFRTAFTVELPRDTVVALTETLAPTLINGVNTEVNVPEPSTSIEVLLIVTLAVELPIRIEVVLTETLAPTLTVVALTVVIVASVLFATELTVLLPILIDSMVMVLAVMVSEPVVELFPPRIVVAASVLEPKTPLTNPLPDVTAPVEFAVTISVFARVSILLILVNTSLNVSAAVLTMGRLLLINGSLEAL